MSQSNSNSDLTWQKLDNEDGLSSMPKTLFPKEDFDTIENKTSSLSSLPSIITQDSLETLTSNDAHKLANVLQLQLDAINEELA